MMCKLLMQFLLFPIKSKGSFICRQASTAFGIPVVKHWLEREIAQWVHHKGSIRRPIAPWVNALTTEQHLAPTMKDWSDDPSHHEQTLLPQSDISVPPWRINLTTHRTMSKCSYNGMTSRSHHEGSIRQPITPWVTSRSHHEGSIQQPITPWANALTTERHLAPTMKDRSDEPLHHERTLPPRSDISVPPWRIDPTTHRTMSEPSYHGATSRSHHEGSIRRPIAPWATSHSWYTKLRSQKWMTQFSFTLQFLSSLRNIDKCGFKKLKKCVLFVSEGRTSQSLCETDSWLELLIWW